MILPITFILLIFQFIINFVSRNKQSGVLLLFVLSLVIAFWRGFHKVNFRIQIVSELLSFIFLSNASSIFSRICLCSLIFGTKHKKLSLNKNVSAFPVRRSGSLKNYKKSIFFYNHEKGNIYKTTNMTKILEHALFYPTVVFDTSSKTKSSYESSQSSWKVLYDQ